MLGEVAMTDSKQSMKACQSIQMFQNFVENRDCGPEIRSFAKSSPNRSYFEVTLGSRLNFGEDNRVSQSRKRSNLHTRCGSKLRFGISRHFQVSFCVKTLEALV